MRLPTRTMYNRWMGRHAPAIRRLGAAALAGAIVGTALSAAVAWQVAVLAGWNATAITFLLSVAPIIVRADAEETQHLAVTEDVSREAARLLLSAAAAASLVAVAFGLGLAKGKTGGEQFTLIVIGAVTVVMSWTVVNTLFTLRYAHLYYREAPESVDFESGNHAPPDYRDFAYLAFTIGMTYQVSDTTLRDRRIRRAVITHALISYAFGVIIIAASVNTVAGLLA